MPDIVAIQQVGMPTEAVQTAMHQVGDARLTRPGESGQPHDAWLLSLELAAGGLADVERLPVDVLGPAKGELDKAGADRPVRDAIDQDEGAQVPVLRIGLES